MIIDYKKELLNELNEPVQEFENAENNTEQTFDDMFDEHGNGVEAKEEHNLFDEPEKQQTKTDVNAIYTFFDSFNQMTASLISNFTGQDSSNYKPNAEQTKTVAKAFVAAFPVVDVSPKTALILTIFMVYSPIAVKAFKDITAKKHEASTIDNNTGN